MDTGSNERDVGNNILISGIASSSLSICATILVLVWWTFQRSIGRKDRHRIIATIIFFDLFRAINFLAFGIRFVYKQHEFSSPAGRTFCRKLGFFTALALEGSDFNSLFLGMHTAVVIFGREKRIHQSVIYRMGFLVLFSLVLPGLFAGCGFINGTYGPIFDMCYIRPFPARDVLALAWIPRGFIMVSIVVMYIAVYIHVAAQMKAVDSELKSLIPQSQEGGSNIRKRNIIAAFSKDSPDRGASRMGHRHTHLSDNKTLVDQAESMITASQRSKLAHGGASAIAPPVATNRGVQPERVPPVDLAFKTFGTYVGSPIEAFDVNSATQSLLPHFPRSSWRTSRTAEHRNLFWLSLLPYFGSSTDNVASSAGRESAASVKRFSTWLTAHGNDQVGNFTFNNMGTAGHSDDIPENITPDNDMTDRQASALPAMTASREIQHSICLSTYSRFQAQKHYIFYQMHFMFVYPLAYLLLWAFPLADQCMIYTVGVDPQKSAARAAIAALASWSIRFTGFVNAMLFYIREKTLSQRNGARAPDQDFLSASVHDEADTLEKGSNFIDLSRSRSRPAELQDSFDAGQRRGSRRSRTSLILQSLSSLRASSRLSSRSSYFGSQHSSSLFSLRTRSSPALGNKSHANPRRPIRRLSVNDNGRSRFLTDWIKRNLSFPVSNPSCTDLINGESWSTSEVDWQEFLAGPRRNDSHQYTEE